MEVMIKCRSGKLTDDERNYLEQKLQKLERYSDGIGQVTVECTRTQQRNAGETQIIQATLSADHGIIIRAEERDTNFNAAVDALHDRLQRQLTRFKDRHYRRGHLRRPTAQGDQTMLPAGDTAASQGNGEIPRLLRTKQFRYKPMYSDEAIEQMELLGHDFFVFTDRTTAQVSVVYRRNDGNYGMIEPATDEEA